MELAPLFIESLSHERACSWEEDARWKSWLSTVTAGVMGERLRHGLALQRVTGYAGKISGFLLKAMAVSFEQIGVKASKHNPTELSKHCHFKHKYRASPLRTASFYTWEQGAQLYNPTIYRGYETIASILKHAISSALRQALSLASCPLPHFFLAIQCVKAYLLPGVGSHGPW